MAVWAGEKEGRKHFMIKVSLKQKPEGGGNSSGSAGTANQNDGWGGGTDDEIPF